MPWDVELAKEFKKRNNKASTGPLLGDVISSSPLKVAILGNKVILTEKQCYICSSLVDSYIRKANIKLDTVTDHGTISTPGEIQFKEILKSGDRVLCLPTADGQRYFIIDKVVI